MIKDPQKKIKVLHILERIRIGGPGRFLFDLLNNIGSDGIGFTICVLEKTKNFITEEIDRIGVPIYPVNVRTFEKLIGRLTPDIIHVHSAGAGKIVELCCSLDYSPPVIQQVLTWSKFLPVSPAVKKIVLVSKSLKEIQPEDSRMCVINCGVDLRLLKAQGKRENTRKALGIDNETVVVGMVCRFLKSKVGKDTLNVFIELVKQRPEIKVLLVGPYDDIIEEFKQNIFALNMADNFIITGERGDVSDLYEAMDLFVYIPASTIIDTFGLVVAEAMAKGLPVVSVDRGGIRDIIKDGESGVLREDADDIVKEAIKLIDNPKIRKRLGKKAVLRAKKFDIKRVSKQYRKLYQSLSIIPSHRFRRISRNIDIKDYFENKNNSLSKGLVSIIVPVYNGGHFLKECLDSIFRQTYEKFEIIVVNDGSSDDTEKVLRTFAYDPRLKVISKPFNSGIPESLNMGYRLAEGEFFTRVDADDMVLENWLETSLYFLNIHRDIGLVFPDIVYFGSINNISRRSFSSDKLFFKKSHIALGHVCRREALECTGGWDPKFTLCEDFDLNLRADEQLKILPINLVLYKPRLHTGGITRRYGGSFFNLDLMAQEDSLSRRGVIEPQ